MNALVTTFNEADTIGPLVAALREMCSEVVVVDDAHSDDGTDRIAAAFGAHVIRGPAGIGPCLLEGFRRLDGSDVVVIDAGGSHNPLDVLRFPHLLADVTIGSRFVPGARYVGRPVRARASRWYSRLCTLRTGWVCADWTSGFRLYRSSAVQAILSRPPKARMHGFQPEALAVCLRAKQEVVEYPIVYRAGRSSMNRQVAVEAVRTVGRLRCW